MAKVQMPSDEKAQFLFEVVEDRKAIEPVLLDLRGKTLLADFFLVCAGFNNIHIRAIAERVLEEAEDRRLPTPRTEGEQVGEWVLIDFGDVVLHVMTEEARERYKLEEYWTHPQPKGALPPTPDSVGSANATFSVSKGDALFEDEDEFEEDEEEDAAFFDEADTEVEPIDEEDEDFVEEEAEYTGEISEEDVEDYEEGSEEQEELDDYDEPEDAEKTPAPAALAEDVDEGSTFARFDGSETNSPRRDATDALFTALNNNAQPDRRDAELDDDDLPDADEAMGDLIGEDLVADGDIREAFTDHPMKYNPDAAAVSDSTPPANTPGEANPSGTADGVGEASTR
ncbi:MAG: ribosome silencing factor [Capsulimonadales bacterium]|nr:ribosome silencing factor [Capsulimonadales bacterium]